MITEHQINNAYSRLHAATSDYRIAEMNRIAVKEQLEIDIAGGILSGEITGKNEKERAANARDALPLNHEALSRAQHEAGEASLALALAEIEVSRCRTLLRLMEATPEVTEA